MPLDPCQMRHFDFSVVFVREIRETIATALFFVSSVFAFDVLAIMLLSHVFFYIPYTCHRFYIF